MFIGCSNGHYPRIGDFALGDSSLSLVLGDLYLLLCQSLGWFELVRGVLRRENMSFEVRSSDLEANLSSSTCTGGVKTNTAVSVPLSSHPSISTSSRSFYALQEECSLREDTFLRFRDRFLFPKETRVCLPWKGEKSCAFAPGEVCFYEAAFLCGLRFPVHPFIMKLLHYLNIALGQLMPNLWRIVISCMVIWMIIADDDMITLNEFIHLYRLKESKKFGYYELMPWDRRSWLIVNLPSSFRY